MSMHAIDFKSIAAEVDLPRMMASEGVEVRRGRAFCPFHENVNTPALSVYARGGIWKYKCHACAANGDAISWVSARANIPPAEAARRLRGLHGRQPEPGKGRKALAVESGAVTAKASSKSSMPDRRPAFEDPEWQAAVDSIVRRAESCLWSPAGVDALAYLRSRGLADRTIRHFRLGFVQKGYETNPLEALADKDGWWRPIYASRGVVLPWISPSAWYTSIGPSPDGPRFVGANVRRLAEDVFEPVAPAKKCLALAGSTRGYAYPWAELLDSQVGPPALICEGEFDSLLAHQECGHLVHIVSVGGASQTPHRSALEALSVCPAWLLSLDYDAAGSAAAVKWDKLAPAKCRRILLPVGKDLGEFFQAGGDLRAWVGDELRRLASDPPR